MAVDVLRSKGVPEERILFLNLIASPEGAANFSKKYPKLRIVTAFVDEGLNEKKYVSPQAIQGRLLIADGITAISFPDSVILVIDSIPFSDLACLSKCICSHFFLDSMFLQIRHGCASMPLLQASSSCHRLVGSRSSTCTFSYSPTLPFPFDYLSRRDLVFRPSTPPYPRERTPFCGVGSLDQLLSRPPSSVTRNRRGGRSPLHCGAATSRVRVVWETRALNKTSPPICSGDEPHSMPSSPSDEKCRLLLQSSGERYVSARDSVRVCFFLHPSLPSTYIKTKDSL